MKRANFRGLTTHLQKSKKLEIDYLNEKIDNLLSELVLKKQKVEELQARLNELEEEGQGDNEE
jgi:predicted RNase H-like nuclease (RuvC/YqgF family)